MLIAAFQRVEEFLEEEEVPAWMSTFKSAHQTDDTSSVTREFDPRLGAANATFRWYKTSRKADNATLESAAPAPPTWYKRSPLSWFRAEPVTANEVDRAQAPVPEEQPFHLRDINVIFPRGKLSVIVGPTGSGKSSRELLSSPGHRSSFLILAPHFSVLAALLGEMECLSGTVLIPKAAHRVAGSEHRLIEGVSFCAQHPWLESSAFHPPPHSLRPY
jgi:hypothetical protein